MHAVSLFPKADLFERRLFHKAQFSDRGKEARVRLEARGYWAGASHGFFGARLLGSGATPQHPRGDALRPPGGALALPTKLHSKPGWLKNY